MSVVNVTDVTVGKNPAALTDKLEMHVSLECLENLNEHLGWKLIYVGSADKKDYDQELDFVSLTPVQRGALKFQFNSDAPDFTKIPPEDIHGITVILLTGSYKTQEFIRIGWYVHNTYTEEALQENPPDTPQIDKMQRCILTDAPRITRFNIDWDKPNPELIPPPESETEESGVENDPKNTNTDSDSAPVTASEPMKSSDKQVIDPEKAKNMTHAQNMISAVGVPGAVIEENKK